MNTREEIATRLACSMLTNSDPITVAHADKIPEICVTMASTIMLLCKQYEAEERNALNGVSSLALIHELAERGEKFVIWGDPNPDGNNTIYPHPDGSRDLCFSDTPDGRAFREHLQEVPKP